MNKVIVFRQISVEKAALLLAEENIDNLYYLTSCNDLGHIKNYNVIATQIKNKKWFLREEVNIDGSSKN